jgi:hypothetical protein
MDRVENIPSILGVKIGLVAWRERERERVNTTLIVSSQLNVASVMRR